MGDNFAFFLPVMMATFSVAFLLAWRWGAREALFWSGGYAFAASGFVVSSLVPEPDPGYWPLLADLLFATGFLLFSEALLVRWRAGWMRPLRTGIWAASLLGCALAIHGGNLWGELIASDLGCFLLITVPLVAGIRRLDAVVERVLFAAICLVAFDNLSRAATVTLTIAADANDHFIDSRYAFLMQALASMFGLFMGLAALAAAVVDKTARLREDAHLDPLSGLLNRRGFDHAVAPRGPAPPGCVVTCDIDHFKRVNDEHGHAAGDRVIVALAALIRDALPHGGVAARFGGEEFVLFLPRADAGSAARIAEHLRQGFAVAEGLTASFGLAVTMASDYSLHDAIARADLALYEAKRAGRNRVDVWRSLSVSDGSAHAA